MLGNHAEFGIFRKEWVTRRWQVAVCAALVIGAWLKLPQLMAGAPLIFGVLIGAGWLAPEEQEPARWWLGTLPISRQRVLVKKFMGMLSLFLMLLILASVLSVSFHPYDGIALRMGQRMGQQELLILFALEYSLFMLGSLAAMVLAMIVALHARSYITTLALTGVIGLVPGALIVMNITLPWQADDMEIETFARPLVGLLGLTVGLLGWLWFVWCKTRLRELSARARSGALLLFMFSLWEISFPLFSTDWRNLWFFLTGH